MASKEQMVILPANSEQVKDIIGKINAAYKTIQQIPTTVQHVGALREEESANPDYKGIQFSKQNDLYVSFAMTREKIDREALEYFGLAYREETRIEGDRNANIIGIFPKDFVKFYKTVRANFELIKNNPEFLENIQRILFLFIKDFGEGRIEDTDEKDSNEGVSYLSRIVLANPNLSAKLQVEKFKEMADSGNIKEFSKIYKYYIGPGEGYGPITWVKDASLDFLKINWDGLFQVYSDLCDVGDTEVAIDFWNYCVNSLAASKKLLKNLDRTKYSENYGEGFDQFFDQYIDKFKSKSPVNKKDLN